MEKMRMMKKRGLFDMYRNIKNDSNTCEVRLSDRNLMAKFLNEGDNFFNQFLQNNKHTAYLFKVEKLQLTKKRIVMKMKQNHLKTVRSANLNLQKERNFMFLETNVLFRVKSVENSKKYMQTVQPFLVDVGYNILGEGQLFIDETAGYAYNIKRLPLLAINWLLNRVDSEISIQEGEAICHH